MVLMNTICYKLFPWKRKEHMKASNSEINGITQTFVYFSFFSDDEGKAEQLTRFQLEFFVVLYRICFQTLNQLQELLFLPSTIFTREDRKATQH